MKKLLVLSLLFLLTPHAHAAFVEQFDSYSNGNNLDTLNGGSGWNGAWARNTQNAALLTVSNAQSVSTANSLLFSTSVFSTAQDYQRQFGSAISSGTFYLSWRTTGTQTNVKNINLANGSGGNNIILQHMHTGNKLQYFNGGGYTDLFSFTNDTWYRIGIQIDAVGNANKARYNVSSNGGTEGDIVPWTAYTSANGTWANINYITFYNAGSASSDYIDDISDTYTITPPATAPLLPILSWFHWEGW